jgi:hypothetical protein
MVVLGVDPGSGTRYLIDFLNERGLRTEDNIAQRAVDMAVQYQCHVINCEVRNIQASIFEKIRDMARPHGIDVRDYKTASATGAQAQESDFNITSIGKLMDERMFRLPFASDPDTQRRMHEFIGQFKNWRPRPPGKTSWHLIRDIVMATLFAEYEARQFVRNASQETKRPRRGDAPKWASNKEGGWAWTKRRPA